MKEHKSKFAPWKILRAIDMSAVSYLNYNGVKHLEVLKLCKSIREVSYLPAPKSREHRVNSLDNNIFLLRKRKRHLVMRKCFNMVVNRLCTVFYKYFVLYELAQTDSVEQCITLDSTELHDGIFHLTVGVKITYQRAPVLKDDNPLSYMEGGLG